MIHSRSSFRREECLHLKTPARLARRQDWARLLPRGDWMSDAGALLQPAIPEFLGKLDTGGRRATRLDLANWLVSPENPLTARVFVNRLWRQFFGTGLSRNSILNP